MTEKERAGEEIARDLIRIVKLMSQKKSLTFSAYKKQADKILSIKGLVVEAKDQTKPKNPWDGEIDFYQNIRLATKQGYDQAQQDMKDWRKIE